MSEQMFPVTLVKNYAPIGDFNIVGWHKPERVQKGPDGKMHVMEVAEFVEGEMAPAPFPGVGFPNKIWAKTVIELPLDEAKGLVAKRIAERADAIG
jgi:hypothetical protein